MKSLREYEKRITEEPDYYTNKEKVHKRWREIADKFGLSIETNKLKNRYEHIFKTIWIKKDG